MTKWFDTNYHYIVPEFEADTHFSLNPTRLLEQLAEAKAVGVNTKPVIIGPVTYLWLGKAKNERDRLSLLDDLLPVYTELLQLLADNGAEWVQIDEPILVTELRGDWRHALNLAYHNLKANPVKLLLTTYFGQLRKKLQLACELPEAGLHLDATNARDEVTRMIDWLEPVYQKLRERLWIAPSCWLLHLPVELDNETGMDPEIHQKSAKPSR